MKHIFLLLWLAPVCVWGQTKAEARLMKQYVQCYNDHADDCICALIGQDTADCFWLKVADPQDLRKRYGKLLSYSYLGIDTTDPGKVTVYKIVWEKQGVKAMSFTMLDDHFGTFRFSTRSDEIERMLKQAE